MTKEFTTREQCPMALTLFAVAIDKDRWSYVKKKRPRLKERVMLMIDD
jgi:hypothetical protein